MSENWTDYLQNPNSYVIKKYLYDILGDKYPEDDSVIDRVAKSLVTSNDTEAFGKLVISLYEAGFMQAVRENKKKFEELGYKVNIIQPKANDTKKIFK